MLHLFAFSYCSWGSQGKNTVVVCHSLLQWTTFCQALTNRDIPFSCSMELDDVPGALAVPLIIFVEHLNLHWLSGVSQCAARGGGKGPAVVAWKWVWGRLERMLVDTQEQRAPQPHRCCCQLRSQFSTQESLANM